MAKRANSKRAVKKTATTRVVKKARKTVTRTKPTSGTRKTTRRAVHRGPTTTRTKNTARGGHRGGAEAQALQLPVRKTISLRQQNVMAALETIDTSAQAILEANKALMAHVQELEHDLETTRASAEQQFDRLRETMREETATLIEEIEAAEERNSEIKAQMERELAAAERLRQQELQARDRDHQREAEKLERRFEKERDRFREQLEDERRGADEALHEARAEWERSTSEMQSEYEARVQAVETSLASTEGELERWRERCRQLEARLNLARDYIEKPLPARA